MFHIKLSTQHAREGPPEIAVHKMCSDGSLKSLVCKLMPRKKQKFKKEKKINKKPVQCAFCKKKTN